MPFYEYQCAACAHHHEELQKVSDRPLRKCPACGRSSLRRLVSAPVFRLKGGGWYETDFKNDKEAKRNLAGEKVPATDQASAEKPADKSADKPSESKPETKDAPEKKGDSPTAGAAPRKSRRAARRKSVARHRRR
jgi:putative FmdB family regulatory protein